MLLTARTMALTTLAWLTNMVLVVTAEVCTSQQPLTKSKSCPGFKDKEAEEHCCPSAIEPGTFFCCDQARLNELEQERQAAVRRAFLAKYLAWIVLGSLALLIVIVTVILTVCYKHKNCPLARRKRDRRKTQAENRAAATSSFTSRYRPVPIETIEPKPSPYDAPPPYPFAHECSTQPPATSAARGTDWRCLAENEVNLERLTMTSNREQSDSGSRGPRSSRT